MRKDSKKQTIPPAEFKLGEEVIAVFPNTAVLPLVVGQTYTITNMKYNTKWGWAYEIENYKQQIYDYAEFSTYFRHKHEIKEDINKEENIKKFMRLASFTVLEEDEIIDRYDKPIIQFQNKEKKKRENKEDGEKILQNMTIKIIGFTGTVSDTGYDLQACDSKTTQKQIDEIIQLPINIVYDGEQYTWEDLYDPNRETHDSLLEGIARDRETRIDKGIPMCDRPSMAVFTIRKVENVDTVVRFEFYYGRNGLRLQHDFMWAELPNLVDLKYKIFEDESDSY